ncbi:MAG: hypothetical protein JKX69_05725, partial [Rhodobacteraceae bacterium]|nr:hypothetical protein [Paracoccaceae bacterium]
AAFSVAAPGARVLALRPTASLAPSVAGWDKRYHSHRRLDFTSRYGYAPDMVEAADAAYVVFDPLYPPDAMHAALFHRPNVTALPVRQAGVRIEQLMDMMQITSPIIEEAMIGDLTPVSFANHWRARRQNLPYLRTLLKRLEVSERHGLSALLCRHGLETRDAPLYQRRLDELAELAPTQSE